MKLSTILDQIDLGSVALPEFQRGYVWSREQVRKLMRSLYNGYPVGSLLMWETQTEEVAARGDGPLQKGTVKLLLDGQQRITTLYGVIRGRPPRFFDGDASRFSGLYFNLESEDFEFYGPVKMRDDPLWIDVTALMRSGVGNFIPTLMADPALMTNLQTYINRLNAIENIKQREFHIDNVTGEDKTVDVVVDIFNEVNSGGTKLSQGDLALAKVCASWPQARDEMRSRLNKWERAGFNFKLDWLLRCINACVTGEALFTALRETTTLQFAEGLAKTEHHIDYILNLIASRLGLDHDQVLGSRYSIPLLVRYLENRNGRLDNQSERDRILYWYVHTLLWGRYSGSTESVLQRDLNSIAQHDGALSRLIEQLHQTRGDLNLYPRDFEGSTKGNRFYPLLYMLTRVWHARDWGTDIELKNHLLGKLSSLQVHHIFPKALLAQYSYDRASINAIANFTFLTQETNLRISDSDPAVYLSELSSKNPGAVESHWIPMDPQLWTAEYYLEFLAERRRLLADAANGFLNSLLRGTVPETTTHANILDREVVVIPGRVESDEERRTLLDMMFWMEQLALPQGEFAYELVNDQTKEVLAVLDLAWPDGIQEGRSQPAALLLEEPTETTLIAQQRGFRCFNDPTQFKAYVMDEVVGSGTLPLDYGYQNV